MTVAVQWRERVASTQDEAHRLAMEGAPHGTAVAARIQTGGRGTRGRAWASGTGGLWMSVVTRPIPGAAVETTGIRVGLALAALLETLPGCREPVALKWPNDLYARDRKLGGILVEGRWQGETLNWMVIGAGVNLRNVLPAELADAAIRLSDLGADPGLEELAGRAAGAIADAAHAGGPLSSTELAEFDARDWLRGRRIATPVAGIATGVTPTGRLRVRGAGGQETEVIEPITLAPEGT